MEAFIKKQDFNFIKRYLSDFNNTLRGCLDKNIVETNRSYIQNKIYNQFADLSEEQKDILSINHIIDPIEIEPYLNNLETYVYGMPKISEAQIRKLFRKEKKLKMPSEDILNSMNVYLSWIDEATNKLFIVYNMNNKFMGMTCRLELHKTNNTHICSLCNNIGHENKVAFVTSLCKTDNSKYGTYKSIGFHICLDSNECNNLITSTDKLESLIKEVNNIK